MPIIEGTSRLKSWTGQYDFAVDGGAISTIVLRSDDGQLNANSIIFGGVIDIATACLSATGTIAIQAEGAGDLLAAAVQAALTAGRKSIIPVFTGATTVKTTALRSPSIAIATAAFTAGKFTLILYYR